MLGSSPTSGASRNASLAYAVTSPKRCAPLALAAAMAPAAVPRAAPRIVSDTVIPIGGPPSVDLAEELGDRADVRGIGGVERQRHRHGRRRRPLLDQQAVDRPGKPGV